MFYKDYPVICGGKTNPSLPEVNETMIILHFLLLVPHENKSIRLNQFSQAAQWKRKYIFRVMPCLVPSGDGHAIFTDEDGGFTNLNQEKTAATLN